MSGSAGVWHVDGAPVADELLDAMWDAIAHRGPDHVGRWTSGSFGVAAGVHRVLPASEREEQPFVGRHGDVVVFDGRLDERQSLASLDVPSDAPDGAFVLAAVERWDERFVDHLHGEWAVAVLRPRRGEILLARDPVGTKPLYFARGADVVLFASEIEAILRHPDVPVVPNDDLLAYYLLQGTARENAWQTFFSGVSTVKPGTIVRLTHGGTRWRTFWDFDPDARIRLRSYDDYVDAFRAHFEMAVRRRIRSRRPVAVSLSGGLDSSSILCQALAIGAREPGVPDIVPIHHRGPAGSPSEEWTYVRAIERRWSIDIPTVPLRAGDLVSTGAAQAGAMEMPWLNELWVTSVAFVEAVRAHGAATFLTGHWGDQVLYEQAYLVDSWNHGHWLSVARDIRELSTWEDGGRAWPYARRFLDQLMRWDVPRPLIPFIRPVVARRATASDRVWFGERLRRHVVATDAPAPIVGLSRTPVHARHLYAKLRSKYYTLAMEGDDKAMASLGVGVGAPFLDRDLLAFVMAIPGEMTTHRGRQRSILRDAMRGIVPDEIVDRRSKADFTRLSSDGLAADLSGATDLLLDGEATRLGYLERHALERALPMLQARARGAEAFPGEISDLLGFELWLRWVGDISRVQSSDTRGEDGER